METASNETRLYTAELLLQRVEGDSGFLKELISTFVVSHREIVESITDALRCEDHSRLEGAAHSLKGALQNFCTGKAVQLAYSLELMGRNHSEEDGVAALEMLKAEITWVLSELAAVEKSL